MKEKTKSNKSSKDNMIFFSVSQTLASWNYSLGSSELDTNIYKIKRKVFSENTRKLFPDKIIIKAGGSMIRQK